jgi:putative effector of murein hydrolase
MYYHDSWWENENGKPKMKNQIKHFNKTQTNKRFSQVFTRCVVVGILFIKNVLVNFDFVVAAFEHFEKSLNALLALAVAIIRPTFYRVKMLKNQKDAKSDLCA